ncbi:MAG: hypothetical protein LAO24_05115 [Acidobacteriia bacterium]|nr:hypothetical protein [Terriglobia bacterium]
MPSKVISVLLVIVLLHGSLAGQTPAQSPVQTPAKMQQVLRKAQETDKAVKVILNKKIDNQKKLSGKVSDITDTGFVVTDQKTGTAKRLAYADVREVHPKGMSKGTKIALGVLGGVVVAVAILAIWAVNNID